MKIHDNDIKRSINLNIIGTSNIVNACSDLNIKLMKDTASEIFRKLNT